MKLTSKALFYLTEAVEFRMKVLEAALAETEPDDDERADLQNDLAYYGALVEELRKAHAEATV